MYDLNNYRELTAIVYYDKFKLWRDRFPLLDDIPDNDLAYVIFDGLVKPYNAGVKTRNVILNAIQFTAIADSYIYIHKKRDVMRWLLEGVELFRLEIERYLPMFSEVKNIFTETNSKCNYIMVNICGDRERYDREIIDRTPSTDLLAELRFSTDFAKIREQAIFSKTDS